MCLLRCTFLYAVYLALFTVYRIPCRFRAWPVRWLTTDNQADRQDRYIAEPTGGVLHGFLLGLGGLVWRGCGRGACGSVLGGVGSCGVGVGVGVSVSVG